jgi:hypothetical protein
MLLVFGILAVAFGIPAARAHPSDISYLKVKIQRQQVEMRFTFNLLTLTRFAPGMDSNGDHQIDKAELEAASPALQRYLDAHIQVNVNEKSATLGTAKPFECVWPSEDGKHTATEADYPVRYVDIVFTQEAKPVLADLWLDFDLWQQTGPLGSIEATYEQDDLITQVPFTMDQPDYLYDTGYTVEGVTMTPLQPSAPSHTAAQTPTLSWMEIGLGLGLVGALVSWLLAPRLKR